MTLEELINEAVAHYLKTKNYLPLKFLRVEKDEEAKDLYNVYFTNTLIEQALSKAFTVSFASHKAKFSAPISNMLLDPSTLQCDFFAKIPENISDEKKFILRIAWAFHNAYHKHIFACYKCIESDYKKLTWDNAKKWYDNLK